MNIIRVWPRRLKNFLRHFSCNSPVWGRFQGTLRWRQKDAAAMLGISTRQLRSYKANPPDPYWPGWEDPVKLKTWFNAREGGARMAEAIKRHLPLREGGVTERGMAGSRLPARRT